VTPAGKIERLEVPRDREGEFVTEVFESGLWDALTYLSYPGAHHARIRSTNMLERLFKEVKRRTRVVGVFPNERSASTLATEIALRSIEEWALRRYLTMDALEAVNNPNPQHSSH
jgi:putative transposase